MSENYKLTIMKKLSIEEKAKRYDEALERAKNTIEVNQTIPDIVECVESLFPELAESEDERIRKELINFLENVGVEELKKIPRNIKEWFTWLKRIGRHEPMTEDFENELAEICNQLLSEVDAEWMNNEILDCIGTSQWLKLCDDTAKRYKDGLLQLVKQCEHKPAVIIPKFRVGDEIKTANEESLTITKIDEKGYWSEDLFICDFDEECIWDLVEQKPAWSEEDERTRKAAIEACKYMVDNFENSTQRYEEALAWLKKQRPSGCPEYCVMSNCANCPYRPVLIKKPNKWKQENTSDLTDFENVMMHIGNSFFGENAGLDPNDTNAIKEQASILLGLVPQQEWNYNDEIIIETIIQEIEKIPSEKFIDNAKYRCLDWLRYRIKSLRPQSQWKPSELQLECLSDAIEHYHTLNYPATKLVELLEQLKKL